MDYKFSNIIVSGLPASGKSVLVKGLEKELGWKTHSVGELLREKHKKQLESGKTKLNFVDWWPALSDEEQIKVNEDLFSLIEKGSIIADTRYAELNKDTRILYAKTQKPKYAEFRSTNSLLIFVTAPIETRMERISKDRYPGKNSAFIKSELEKREYDEYHMGKTLFEINYKNPNVYHFIINSGLLTPNQEISQVMNLMQDAR